MKRFSLISTWAVAIALSLSVRGAGKLQADPTDDFSFTLAPASEVESYRIMPEGKVAEILRDHLDLFPRSQTPKLARHLTALCRLYRFDPAFILALIQVESRFQIKVVSPSGAVGLMQLMPATASVVMKSLGLSYLNLGRALRDPYVNTLLGVAYMASLRDHYEGRPPYFMVAAYNVGPARMDELLSRKSFKPVSTRKYFEAIRSLVPGFRFYRRPPGHVLRRPRLLARTGV